MTKKGIKHTNKIDLILFEKLSNNILKTKY